MVHVPLNSFLPAPLLYLKPSFTLSIERRREMGTGGGALYLLCGISAALVLALFLTNTSSPSLLSSPIFDNEYPHGFLPMSSEKVWPELELSWKLVAVTIISFLGSAFGTVGGVGGGGIFVPMLTLIVGFDTKSAAALSKCMITAASAASVWYNLKVPHPTKEAPIIDYDLSLVFQPVLLLGITVGVSLSVVFPYWLITVLIIILFLGTSTRSLFKGLEIWNQETVLLKEMTRQQEALVGSRGEHLIDADYEPLNPEEEKTDKQILKMNLKWKKLMILVLVWLCFLLLEIVENYSTTCGVWYWVLKAFQVPIAFLVSGYGVAKLYRESAKRKALGDTEPVCEATVEWTLLPITVCALGGLLGGTVGGLLGSGSGFIQGPLLLELGVMPQVASATATFVMFFTSSLSVAEFYLLKRFPIPYALYLMSIALIAGFLGQFLVRKLVEFLKRASIIVFILSAVIFASAFTMGVVGIKKIITMIQDQESMGFLDYCSNQ